MLVQDFAEAIKDFDRVIELNPDFVMAYFNRAVVRYKQMEYNQSQSVSENDFAPATTHLTLGKNPVAPASKSVDATSSRLKDNKRAYEHEMIIRDYDQVIRLNPDFVYVYFNRGNLRCVQRDFRAGIADYSAAIERDPEFAEAYFNRGLAYLSMGDANRGIADLSKAGELGIINAYSIIKRMSNN